MNREDLYRAIGAVDDDVLAQSEARKRGWRKWAAACLCLCVLGAVSILHLKGGGQDSAVQAIAALEYGGCCYEVCDLDWVLEKYGLPGRITADMAGEHLAWLRRDGAAYKEAAARTDIELYQYAPAPCRGVCVVREGESYLAALFCNFRLDDGESAVPLSELYRVYGLNAAEDIASIAGAKTVTEPEALAAFYNLTVALESEGNDAFQAAVFGGVPEEDQNAAHAAFADDAHTWRIELKTGLRLYLQVYPGYGWIYGRGAMTYYRMDAALAAWFAK